MPSVLVTGANGFVAYQTLKILLQRGYEVVGTVRSADKITYIKNTLKSDKLAFAVVPDIGTPNAFDDAIKLNHFDAVLHISSPFTHDM